jgi:hypothetical protein
MWVTVSFSRKFVQHEVNWVIINSVPQFHTKPYGPVNWSRFRILPLWVGLVAESWDILIHGLHVSIVWNFSALRIHVSDDSRQILYKFGTFQLELRGEVEQKGKGRVTTHWLLGCSEPDPRPPTPQPCNGTPEASPYPLLFPTNSCTKVSS